MAQTRTHSQSPSHYLTTPHQPNLRLDPASKFDPIRDIPDLSGKVIIVTGGNSGLGLLTATELLRKNAKVYIGCRSKAKAEAAIAEMRAETGKEAIFLELDLASLDSVTRSANEFRSKEPALHVLYNNGGVMLPPVEQLTADGYDLTFGTNVLGPAHFTMQLIPELEAGAKASSDGKARIIGLSSFSAYFESTIDWASVVDSPNRKSLNPQRLYSQSKFAMAVLANEFARRYADKGIISSAVNPGNIETPINRHASRFELFVLGLIQYPASPYGALTGLYAGVSPDTAAYNGAWFIPWARIGVPAKAMKDPELGTKLFEWVEEQRKEHVTV